MTRLEKFKELAIGEVVKNEYPTTTDYVFTFHMSGEWEFSLENNGTILYISCENYTSDWGAEGMYFDISTPEQLEAIITCNSAYKRYKNEQATKI